MSARRTLTTLAVTATAATGLLFGGTAQAAGPTSGTFAQAARSGAALPAAQTTKGLTTSAHQLSPACATNWITIGSPGSFNWNGQYAGQVEQIYDTCSGNVEAHWQWAGGFQSAHPGAVVIIDAAATDKHSVIADAAAQATTSSKDVYTQWGVNIHVANPDTWFVDAYVTVNGVGCGSVAYGTQHIYATGGSGFAASLGGC